MNLTQRTIRITLASVFSIILAAYFGLENSMAAGIIALLSILDTRLETVETGVKRILSTVLAFAIATIIFFLFGYSVLSFGLYLVFYIPLTHLTNLESGLAPCSVLVTHFVAAESISWAWQINGMGIMVIGVVFALIFSFWLPSYDQKLDENVAEVEKQMSYVLSLIDKNLTHSESTDKQIQKELKILSNKISALDSMALIDYENNYFTQSIKDYYVKYAQMRQQQYELLERMATLLPTVSTDTKQRKILASIFYETADQLDEKNPGIELLQSIADLYNVFRKSDLPKTREEFESRAILYDILTDFEKFIVLKRDFYMEYDQGEI